MKISGGCRPSALTGTAAGQDILRAERSCSSAVRVQPITAIIAALEARRMVSKIVMSFMGAPIGVSAL